MYNDLFKFSNYKCGKSELTMSEDGWLPINCLLK